MKKDKDMENILLNDTNMFFEKDIEDKFKNEITKSKDTKINTVTDIKDLDSNTIFSKNAIFEILNRKSKTISYINGIQAESYVANDMYIRNNLLQGKINSFVCGDCYLKFVRAKVCANS